MYKKVGLQVNIQLSKLKRPRKKDTTKKSLQTLNGQKDHLPWTTGKEKFSLIKRTIDLTGIKKSPVVG